MRRSTLGTPSSNHHTGAPSRGQTAPTCRGQGSERTKQPVHNVFTEAPWHTECAQCDQPDMTDVWGTAPQESRKGDNQEAVVGGREELERCESMHCSYRGPELQHACPAGHSLPTVLEDLTPSSGFCGQLQPCAAAHLNIHTLRIKLKFKKSDCAQVAMGHGNLQTHGTSCAAG